MLMHAIRVGLECYMVMLAVMSLTLVFFLFPLLAGHSLGWFLLFGSRVFVKGEIIIPPNDKTSDLPPVSC